MRYLGISNLIVSFLITATACYAAPFSQTYENDYLRIAAVSPTTPGHRLGPEPSP